MSYEHSINMDTTSRIILKNYKIRNFLALIGVILLVIIPKGGFKIANIPITWSYLYLGLIFSIIVFSIKSTFKVNQKTILCYLSTLPFVIYFIIHISVFGYDGTLGTLIAFGVSFIFIPFLFLILLSSPLRKIDINYIEKLIYNAILIISIYGILLFIYKQFVGSYIEIPYVTINADDAGTLESKYNQRGDIFKLISTYNNGNIFGVCVLMLFPVFYKKQKNIFHLLIVCVALLLTLSRTVWIGMVLFFLIEYRSRLLKLIRVYALIISLLFLLSSVVLTSYFQYGSLSNFIFDGNFGGRLGLIRNSSGLSLFGSEPFVIIEEVVYLSIYRQLGLTGLVLFCISLFMPFIVYRYSYKAKNGIYFTGILIYWVLCMSDGCMLLIPTLAFYYFIICMTFVTQNVAKSEYIT